MACQRQRLKKLMCQTRTLFTLICQTGRFFTLCKFVCVCVSFTDYSWRTAQSLAQGVWWLVQTMRVRMLKLMVLLLLLQLLLRSARCTTVNESEWLSVSLRAYLFDVCDAADCIHWRGDHLPQAFLGYFKANIFYSQAIYPFAI